jgi:hypothetical protein
VRFIAHHLVKHCLAVIFPLLLLLLLLLLHLLLHLLLLLLLPLLHLLLLLLLSLSQIVGSLAYNGDWQGRKLGCMECCFELKENYEITVNMPSSYIEAARILHKYGYDKADA